MSRVVDVRPHRHVRLARRRRDRERLARTRTGRIVRITRVVGLVRHVAHGCERARLGRPVRPDRDRLIDRRAGAADRRVAMEDDVAGRIGHRARRPRRPRHKRLVVHNRARHDRRHHRMSSVVDIRPHRHIRLARRRRDRQRLTRTRIGRIVRITGVVGLVRHVAHGCERARLGRPVRPDRDRLIDRRARAPDRRVPMEDDIPGRIGHRGRRPLRPRDERLVVHDRAQHHRRHHRMSSVVDVRPHRHIPDGQRLAGPVGGAASTGALVVRAESVRARNRHRLREPDRVSRPVDERDVPRGRRRGTRARSVREPVEGDVPRRRPAIPGHGRRVMDDRPGRDRRDRRVSRVVNRGHRRGRLATGRPGRRRRRTNVDRPGSHIPTARRATGHNVTDVTDGATV